jgi:hypothetical protein
MIIKNKKILVKIEQEFETFREMELYFEENIKRFKEEQDTPYHRDVVYWVLNTYNNGSFPDLYRYATKHSSYTRREATYTGGLFSDFIRKNGEKVSMDNVNFRGDERADDFLQYFKEGNFCKKYDFEFGRVKEIKETKKLGEKAESGYYEEY